jgi:hypothetical protein
MNYGRRKYPIAIACWLLFCAAAPPVSFATAGPRFAGATDEYRAIWEAEGARIVAALEAATGLAFPPAPIEMIVHEGAPMTAYDGRTIRLRAGYSPDYKRATLVHELGHRLSFLLPRDGELDDHRLLYLFLYDVWTDLYGRDFADRMVAIERRIPGGYDYDAAWRWALAMTREEREARLRSLRGLRGWTWQRQRASCASTAIHSTTAPVIGLRAVPHLHENCRSWRPAGPADRAPQDEVDGRPGSR